MPTIERKTTPIAICRVIDMTCAVTEGNIPEIYSLLKNGFPTDRVYEEGLATLTFADFVTQYGNVEIKTFAKHYLATTAQRHVTSTSGWFRPSQPSQKLSSDSCVTTPVNRSR